MELLTPGNVVLGLGIVAVVAIAIFAFEDLLLALLDLLFLRAILLGAGYLVLLATLETTTQMSGWPAPGEAGPLASGVGLMVIAALTIRSRGKQAAEAKVAAEQARERARARELRGTSGIGRITKIERTGLSINDNPQVELTIDLPLHDGREATLTVQRLVDLVEIPRFQPGCGLRVVYDRDEPENFEIDWEAAVDPATASTASTPGGSVSGTGAPFDVPLWLFGMEQAEAWLFPERHHTAPRVMLIDIGDPHDATASEAREAVVDQAAFVLAEHLWACTDAAASTAVFVEVERRKLIQPVGPASSFEQMRPFIDSLEARPIVVWGHALPDLEREGLALRVRHPEDDAERVFSGPLPELAQMLVDWLVRRGACRRVSPPAWWSAPAPEQLAAYAGVLDHLQLQILADRKNRALDALDAGMHAEFVENALAAADAHAGACALFRLAAATTALYARRADALPSALRRRVIDLLRAQTDPSSPLYQLSPHLLRRLDEPLEAGARAQTLESTASPAYRAWLSRVAGPVD